MQDKYPRGKLNAEDEGATHVAVFAQDKTVIIKFFKELAWIGMDADAARKLAASIIKMANSIDKRDH